MPRSMSAGQLHGIVPRQGMSAAAWRSPKGEGPGCGTERTWRTRHGRQRHDGGEFVPARKNVGAAKKFRKIIEKHLTFARIYTMINKHCELRREDMRAFSSVG